MNVLGVDVSSHAIDLILLDESTDHCTWTHLPLEGPTSFARLRQVHDAMPAASWYDDNGVYLVAIETPKTRFMPSAAALFPVYGAAVAALPSWLPLWDVRPTDWRKGLGLPGNAKKLECARRTMELGAPPGWNAQDPYDAWAVAFFARELNARGVALDEAREKQLTVI